MFGRVSVLRLEIIDDDMEEETTGLKGDEVVPDLKDRGGAFWEDLERSLFALPL